jgi:hypothetical protein
MVKINFMLLFLYIFENILLFLFNTVFHYVMQADLKATMYLPQPQECWDYRNIPTCPAQHPLSLEEYFLCSVYWLSHKLFQPFVKSGILFFFFWFADFQWFFPRYGSFLFMFA